MNSRIFKATREDSVGEKMIRKILVLICTVVFIGGCCTSTFYKRCPKKAKPKVEKKCEKGKNCFPVPIFSWS